MLAPRAMLGKPAKELGLELPLATLNQPASLIAIVSLSQHPGYRVRTSRGQSPCLYHLTPTAVEKQPNPYHGRKAN